MTRTSHVKILSELRSPSSPGNLLVALKDLKHDIIGHDQTKELWLGQGIVAPLCRVLSGFRSRSKRRVNGNNGASNDVERSEEENMEEETVLQAVIIIGILAQGGPPFLPALVNGQVVPPLLSMLSPGDHHPRLVIAVLRTLNTIADASLLDESQSETGDDDDALRPLYADEGLSHITEILDQESPETMVQQQISFAAGLIIKSCGNETRRKQAVQADVLDTLAKRLASFVIARTPVPYLKDLSSHNLPSPATKSSRLSPILHAIATIIAESKSRAFQFINSPIFVPVLAAWNLSRGGDNPLPNVALDSVLPPISRNTSASMSGNFPPLGGLATVGKHKQTKGFIQTQRDQKLYGLTDVAGDEGAPLAYWLAHVAKEETGHAKLMVAWVLTLLFRSGCGGKRLERILSMQLVPVLVQMLDSEQYIPASQHPYDSSILLRPDRLIKEQAPKVLALLVADNEELQFAAAEAESIKKLSQLLKRSFDPPAQPCRGSPWSPDPDANMHAKDYLGNPGISPAMYHILKIRVAVISALAAMATFKDEYRKAVIDNGVVPFIVESLSSETPLEKKAGSTKSSVEKISNPTAVLLAACEAATALSRSVSTLRTSLIDEGLAKPIFKLLKHQDMQVQVAATGAVVNIVLDFSPMRRYMIDAGVQTILCEHAHSVNAKLRLNSLWALKHLVFKAPNDMKKSCLEELGPGWLKQTICNDSENSYGARISGGGDLPLTMESSNAAGEPVDLLNSAEESQLSMQAYDDSDEDEVNMIDSIGALSKPSSRGRGRAQGTAFLDDEAEALAQVKRDDIAVQEQGLDFIRNLISGDSAKELIDYVFDELGQEKLFDILANLLRPRPVDAYSRDRRAPSGVKHVPPHTEIIISVCYILVHLANGFPRHRQLLISHPDLLKLMVPIFNHSASEARSACAWVVINLTWTDDQGDKTNARQRAFELRKLGIETKLDELKDDPVLDTRERVKQAKWQMQELLKN